MTEALPNFMSLLLLDRKLQSSNIRIISDNARSQRNPSFSKSSSSCSSDYLPYPTISSAPLNDTPFHAVNRWNQDPGYDFDTSLTFAGGRRRHVSLKPKESLPSPASSPVGSNKPLSFKYLDSRNFEDKWSKPSSDSCLAVPKRKSSLTKNSFDDQEKGAMAMEHAERPPLVRLSKSKAPPQQTQWCYMDAPASTAPPTSNLSRRLTQSLSTRKSRREPCYQTSVDCILSDTTSAAATTDVPTRGHGRGICQQQQGPCINSVTPNQSPALTSMDFDSDISLTSSACRSPFVVKSAVSMTRKVSPPDTPCRKTNSRKKTTIAANKAERLPSRNISVHSANSMGSLHYRLPMAYTIVST
ncbi:hypothetical protein IV203_021677 [Nitzschia inconspicua]|uniref:Uncharacterized protein n=1 Tax=Nitzschia inconspicua TaxID=303405 RepID=A0A9K3K5U8_9STRA|nr:hypothetical protein IV203_022770 [Nitzschia inconspicua]KAG7343669.1 hypothetical protein IV203_021677 [Nitzschia inconspicua]